MLTSRVARRRVEDMNNPPLVSTANVCERLGIERSTLSRWVQSGRITPAMQLEGRRGAFLFHPADVDRLAAEQARAVA